MARTAYRSGQIGYLLLIGAFFAMPLNALRVAGSITIGDFLLLLAAPFALLALICRRSFPRLPNWLYIGSGLLVLSVVLVEVFPPANPVELTPSTFLQATNPVEEASNVMSGIRLLIALVFLPALTCLLADGWGRIRNLATAWVAGVLFSCAVAVIAAITGVDPLRDWSLFLIVEGVDLGTRAIGLTVHPVTLSTTAVMAAPVIASRITDRRSALTYGPMLALLFVAIMLSGTRTGLLVLVALSVVVLLVDRRTRRVVGPIILAGVVIFAVLVLVAPIPGTERFKGGDESTEVSNNARITLYEESIDYVLDRPIVGNGFQYVRASHNVPLQLLMAGGLIALVGFFTVFVGYLTIGWRSRLRAPENMRRESVGLTLALLAVFLAGITGNDIYTRYLYIPAGLLLAGSLLWRKTDEGSEVGVR